MTDQVRGGLALIPGSQPVDAARDLLVEQRAPLVALLARRAVVAGVTVVAPGMQCRGRVPVGRCGLVATPYTPDPFLRAEMMPFTWVPWSSVSHRAPDRAPRPAPRRLHPPAPTDSAASNAAVASLAPNSRKAYASAWRAWQRWADEHRLPLLPATPVDVADYLMTHHTTGAAPATVRAARATIAQVHRVSRLADPTARRAVRRRTQAHRA